MTYFVKKRGRDIEQLAPLEVEPDPSFFTEQEDVLIGMFTGKAFIRADNHGQERKS